MVSPYKIIYDLGLYIGLLLVFSLELELLRPTSANKMTTVLNFKVTCRLVIYLSRHTHTHIHTVSLLDNSGPTRFECLSTLHFDSTQYKRIILVTHAHVVKQIVFE